MRKLNLIYTQLFFILAVCISGCSQKSNEYTNAIPQDAFVVTSFDVNSLIKKSGLTDRNSILGRLSEEMGTLLGESFNDLKKAFTHPESLGISFADKAYAAIREDESCVLVLKVSDVKKLKNSFASLESEGMVNGIKESSGITHIDMGGEIFVAFNETTFIVMTSSTHSVGEGKSYLVQLMGQKEEQSLNRDKGFRKMQERKSDLAVFINPKAYTELMRQLPADALSYDLSAFSILGGLNFEKGRITMETEVYTEDKNLEKQIKENQRANGKLNSAFLEHFPLSTLAYLTFNLNGEALYNLLANNEQLKKQGLDITSIEAVKEVLASLTGDVSLGVTGLSLMQMSPEVLLLAEVKNNKITEVISQFESLINMQSGISLTGNGTNQYLLKTRQGNFHIGIKDNIFYATNSSDLSKGIGIKQKESLANGEWASAAKRGSGYFLFNANEITQLPTFRLITGLGGAQGKQLGEIFSNLNYLEVFSESGTSATANLYLKNREENALQQLIEAAIQLSGL